MSRQQAVRTCGGGPSRIWVCIVVQGIMEGQKDHFLKVHSYLPVAMHIDQNVLIYFSWDRIMVHSSQTQNLLISCVYAVQKLCKISQSA